MERRFVRWFRTANGLREGKSSGIAPGRNLGKAPFAMNIAEHVAINEKLPVGVFSLEMSSQQLVQRLLCPRARVNLHKAGDEFLAVGDFPRRTAAASKLADGKIFIDERAGFGILDLAV